MPQNGNTTYMPTTNPEVVDAVIPHEAQNSSYNLVIDQFGQDPVIDDEINTPADLYSSLQEYEAEVAEAQKKVDVLRERMLQLRGIGGRLHIHREDAIR